MECEICGSGHMVQKHHIVGGRGKRRQCETKDSVIYLCWAHHHGKYGVHGKYGHTLSMQLKLQLQATYFNQGLSKDEVMRLMGGKLYLLHGKVWGYEHIQ